MSLCIRRRNGKGGNFTTCSEEFSPSRFICVVTVDLCAIIFSAVFTGPSKVISGGQAGIFGGCLAVGVRTGRVGVGSDAFASCDRQESEDQHSKIHVRVFAQ